MFIHRMLLSETEQVLDIFVARVSRSLAASQFDIVVLGSFRLFLKFMC